MKQLLDFLPLVIFFVVYKLHDIFWATGALIAATLAAFLYSWYKFRKVEKTMLVTVVLVAVFGGLTIYFHNPEFIKWKVTIIYALFAGALLIGQWFFNKSLIQCMLGKEITLPQPVWRKLNCAWALFFIACGLLNIYVAFWLSEGLWMNFKVFGLTGLTLLFTLACGVYIYRHLPPEQNNNESKQ
ncbi:septation protein A [Symbiopectobacterium sp. RP]|uniref:septation protein A n=1 Tax=Symbiopectobacterium sp. RP TaxID=3248553 RepID=UPI003D2A8863